MISRGYGKRFVYGLLAAGGTLGILIPPSIPMIVYGFITEESVIALFLAGIVPGLVLVAAFTVYAMIYAWRSPEFQRVDAASWTERRDASLRAFPPFLLAAIVIGGLYSGAFTPTEAAAVGFAAALLITVFMLRTLTWQGFKEAAFESMVTTVAILLIIAGAKIFGKAIALYRIPQDISAFITNNIDGPILFILVVSVVLLLMGLVFEALSMVLIMVPVLLPAALALGFDPIWFGVYVVIMVECALITPPVGLNLYVIQAVARTGLGEVSRGVIPFLLIMLASVVALYIFPDMALYVPFKW
jgi:C4-dicarboxylate transporter DctM subunit